MANKNKNLNVAAKNKKDEFYTRREDKNNFKDKIVFCNCDDPYESEFFKFFAVDFRSQECIEILKSADIVVTNPTFSLFKNCGNSLRLFWSDGSSDNFFL